MFAPFQGSETFIAIGFLFALLLGHSPNSCAGDSADDSRYFGLLRARDLTPFGFLRLDMRPAHAVSTGSGKSGVEVELAYQNTWALSPNVEHYLESLTGRRELGPTELQAIRNLPGENYLVDLELAELDITLHHRFSSHWDGYVVLSGVTYQGGFLDGTIEKFHRVAGFSSFGRPAISRNSVNIILDLKSQQYATFDMPTSGGLLDPTFGLRYSMVAAPRKWNLILETAIKAPILGERQFLSTGKADIGAEATLQRFWRHQALYVSASAVRYEGNTSVPATSSQTIPTLVVGYERRLTSYTHMILQGYVSPSVYTKRETDLKDLLATKYQLSLGVYHRTGNSLISFAVTENLQNVNNTPDFGFQLGWSHGAALSSSNDR